MPEDIKQALRASLKLINNEEFVEEPEQNENKTDIAVTLENGDVVDLELERIQRDEEVTCHEVTPAQVLKLALKEAGDDPYITKCYVTLIQDGPEGLSTINLRSKLSRQEEVAFRQLGVHEAVESWRT